MLITVNKKVNEVVEVNLPCFVKFAEHYTRIDATDKHLVVENWGFSKKVEHVVSAQHNPFANEGWEFITEEQFNDKLTKVLSELNKVASSFIEKIITN